MPTLTLNGKPVEFEKGMTLIQVCDLAGIEIPRFCYHDKLKIAGNCRMCLVEVKGGPPKPAASCAMPAAEGMVVFTDSPMVKKAREGVMEFLLINHPLDCPICDQGGECDLQDQAMAYGKGGSRFEENKRAVKDKNMGPLVKTHMTRCIHCTRCVRFMEEVAGAPEMGAVYRGEHMEIATYLEQAIHSEMSGNIIDLCPVGALTSKPYAYRARSWELKKTESIDVLDAVGSNIRIDARGNEVMRILPRLNEDVNEEWISDKTRFACDGLKNQRLDRPYIKKDGKLQEASWDDALDLVAQKLKKTKPEKIAAIVGDLVDAESMFVLKEIADHLGSPNIDCRQDGMKLDATNRGGYLFNTTIAGIESADFCLLIGANPRLEAPLVNARLRKRQLKGGFEIASIGAKSDLNYKVNYLGNSVEIIEEILKNTHTISAKLKQAKTPILIIGAGVYAREDGAAILNRLSELATAFGVVKEGWNGWNILHQSASRVAALDLGFVPGKNGKDVAGILEAAESGVVDVLYLLGADEIDTSRLKKSFVIYQGHHGDQGAHAADVILPGAAYTEKSGIYLNMEGRVQRTQKAVFPPGQAKQDYEILAQVFSKILSKEDCMDLGALRAAMYKAAPHFANIDAIKPSEWQPVGKKGTIAKKPLLETVTNFYMTDPISRASATMAKCAAELSGKHKKAEVA